MSKPVCTYQHSDTRITLREGLKEYYDANPGFKGEGHFLGQPRQTVIDHDVCHVVFGLGTTSRQELLVEAATLFGCIIPVKKTREILGAGFFTQLWQMFGPWRLAKRFILTTPAMLRMFFMARGMKKKWPHFDYASYMDIPLEAIRTEFGIRLIE